MRKSLCGLRAGSYRMASEPGLAAGLRRRRRREPVPAHDLAELRWIGRTAATRRQHLMDLGEVVGTHDPGGRDRQELRVLSASVLESVDGAPGDAEGIADTDLDGAAVNGPRGDTLEPVDRLLKRIVAVGGRHPAVGWDEALEDAHAAVGVRCLHEESDAHRTDPERLLRIGSCPVETHPLPPLSGPVE